MTIRQRYFFEKLYKNLGSSHPLILKINNIPKSRNIFEGKPYKPNIRRLPFKETVIFGGLARLAYYFAERLVLWKWMVLWIVEQDAKIGEKYENIYSRQERGYN